MIKYHRKIKENMICYNIGFESTIRLFFAFNYYMRISQPNFLNNQKKKRVKDEDK
jgi:hypothetical protein